jgi:hypothetical protein
MGYGDVLVHQRGGPRFRKHRRIVQDHFSAKSLATTPACSERRFIPPSLTSAMVPRDFDRHLKRYDFQHALLDAINMVQ